MAESKLRDISETSFPVRGTQWKNIKQIQVFNKMSRCMFGHRQYLRGQV